MPEEYKNLFAEFRQAREKQKEVLETISRKLKIQKKFLENIEKGEVDFLPKVYAGAMIKKYSQYLNLDSQKYLAALKNENGQTDVLPKNRFSFYSKKFITGISVFLGLIILYLAIQLAQILLPPQLKVFSPQNNLIVSSPLLDVSGWATSGAEISLNNEKVYPSVDGTFEKQIVLSQGVNALNFTAINKFGKSQSIIRRVIYQTNQTSTTSTNQ